MNYARYICTICNFVFEEDQRNPFANLADSWRCPSCDSPKEMFLGCACTHYDIYEQTRQNAPVQLADSQKHLCSACDFIYDNLQESQRFETLDETWVCPGCGVSKEFFETCTCVRIDRAA